VRASLTGVEGPSSEIWTLVWTVVCPGPFLVIFCALLGAVAGFIRSRM